MPCGKAHLDDVAEAAPCAGMTARASLLQRLRRSGLGVWLAVAYAWGVLALAVAPVPAYAALSGHDGAVLCSGAPVPDDGSPVPAGELSHCKGCPLNPVLAGPPTDVAPVAERLAVRLSPQPLATDGLAHRFATGLAQSRAPPVG